tara:strand:- start:1049 stop:2197 length:1149 start_codon:yes stop_codon:yes gene_type:complete
MARVVMIREHISHQWWETNEGGVVRPAAEYASLGDEGIYTTVGFLLRNPSYIEAVNDCSFVVFEQSFDFFDWHYNQHSPAHRATETLEANNLVGGLAENAVELAKHITRPIFIQYEHGNFDEAVHPCIASGSPMLRELLALDHVVGIIEWVPYQHHIMRAMFDKVLWLPMPYVVNDHFPTDVEDPYETTELRQVFVSKAMAHGHQWRDHGLPEHLVAKVLADNDPNVRVVYRDTPNDPMVEIGRHFDRDEIGAALEFKAHAPLPLVNLPDALRQLAESHLFLHMGWRNSTQRWSMEAAYLRVPAVVSTRLCHRTQFPYTHCDSYNITKAVRLGERCLYDAEFRERVRETAYRRTKRNHDPANITELAFRHIHKAGLWDEQCE